MPSKFTPLKDHDTPIKVLFTGYLITAGIGYMLIIVEKISTKLDTK
ncbi:MAG: hypothetical protein O2966_05005 [Proteobacteria bacterium]|nr:hypothetical protein [Pseudomonadota bacterium]